MEVIALIVFLIGICAFLSGDASISDVGKFWFGIIMKSFYSSIAIGLCMAIPIPILNVIIAVIIVLQIWGSPVEF